MASTSSVAQGKRPQTPYTPSDRATLLDDEGAMTDKLVDVLEAIFLKYAVASQVIAPCTCSEAKLLALPQSRRRAEKRTPRTVARIPRFWTRKASSDSG